MPNGEVHSPLGGSGVERYANCPGAPALSKLVGHDPEAVLPTWTAEGLLAHAIIERLLKEDKDLWEIQHELEELTVMEWEKRREIVAAVTMASEYMRTRPGRHFVELELAHPAFHPLMYSRLDFAAVQIDPEIPVPTHVEIVDYKNGAGVRVEAKGNLQTRYYAFAFLDGQKWPPFFERAPDECPVKLTILQPNVYDEPQYDMTTAGELRNWAYNELRPMMQRTERDQYLAVGEWCRFCPARAICPAHQGLIKAFAGEIPDEIANMTNERLAELFPKIEAVKIGIKALQAEIVRRNLSGNTVPGTKMVEGKAWRVWNKGAEQAARDNFGDRAFELKLLSPARIEDEFGAKGKVFASTYGLKPPGKPIIAVEGDSRQALSITTPADRLRKMLEASVDSED